jgi:hypothetical protein
VDTSFSSRQTRSVCAEIALKQKIERGADSTKTHRARASMASMQVDGARKAGMELLRRHANTNHAVVITESDPMALVIEGDGLG